MRMDGRCCILITEREHLFTSPFLQLLLTLPIPFSLGMDYIKNVVEPIRQVAPRQILRGLQEDYAHLSADVVLLAGEVHYERKPVSNETRFLNIFRLFDDKGGLRFTTTANRNWFSRLVLYHVRAPHDVYELAAKLATRMKEKNEGRMWLGAHMRRGDCKCHLFANPHSCSS